MRHAAQVRKGAGAKKKFAIFFADFIFEKGVQLKIKNFLLFFGGVQQPCAGNSSFLQVLNFRAVGAGHLHLHWLMQMGCSRVPIRASSLCSGHQGLRAQNKPRKFWSKAQGYTPELWRLIVGKSVFCYTPDAIFQKCRKLALLLEVNTKCKVHISMERSIGVMCMF